MYGMDNTTGCGSSKQTHTMHATPRPDQLAEPTVPTSSAPAIPVGLVATPNPSTPSSPDALSEVRASRPVQNASLASALCARRASGIPPISGCLGPRLEGLVRALRGRQKMFDDLKQALDDALKEAALCSTSALPADSASAAAPLREAAEGQLADLQGHFNAMLQVLSRRC